MRWPGAGMRDGERVEPAAGTPLPVLPRAGCERTGMPLPRRTLPPMPLPLPPALLLLLETPAALRLGLGPGLGLGVGLELGLLGLPLAALAALEPTPPRGAPASALPLPS